ncbi:MAG: hypothetical protein Q6L60_07010 [Thermostichus sp. HHBFW_bins_43]
MPRVPLLKPDQAYTFSSYFELPFEPEDVLPEFGYTFQRRKIDWPKAERIPDSQDLKTNVEQLLPYVSLKSETARREILIAPLLFKVVQHTQAQMRIEYAIQVNDKLKGTLDYYLYTDQSLLIVEAKKADLTQGLTQLSVEMIALDQWLSRDQNVLVGAITSGELWQFALLDRSTQGIYLDPRTYPYPDEADQILSICIASLQSTDLEKSIH